jgi:hypothetical protein
MRDVAVVVAPACLERSRVRGGTNRGAPDRGGRVLGVGYNRAALRPCVGGDSYNA